MVKNENLFEMSSKGNVDLRKKIQLLQSTHDVNVVYIFQILSIPFKQGAPIKMSSLVKCP